MSSKAKNNEVAHVLKVVIGVSLVCSILVAVSAVTLRELQTSNRALDLKKNVLVAGGIFKTGMNADDIEKSFQSVQPVVIDFAKAAITEEVNIETYDMAKASKDPDESIKIPANEDIASIRTIPHYGIIYILRKNEKLDKLIIPISGLGLWSTLYGFVSLENDGKTIAGINFYEHSETPGLGGEVDNPTWQSKWVGKLVYNESGEPIIEVIKGRVDENRSGSEHKVDGISGATITARAVGYMVQFWLDEKRYGKFIKKLVEERIEVQY